MTTLIEVVSELTGYPVEMIKPDMDVEADLGIDSIKRVEILSVIDEKMPGLQAVSPGDMGRLKTLGQIAAYLGASDSVPPRDVIPVETVAGAASTTTEKTKVAPELKWRRPCRSDGRSSRWSRLLPKVGKR